MAYYIGESSCVPLWRYAQILGLAECGLYGVQYDGQEQTGCGVVWTLAERRIMRRYLAEAQEEIERVLAYRLCPRFEADERHPWRARQITRWGNVISLGPLPQTRSLHRDLSASQPRP